MKTAILQRLVRQLRQTAGARQLDGSADADLLKRFQADCDPEAFEAIVRRYGPGVLSACRKVLSSEADIEDAFQATFLVLWQNAGGIRQRRALGGWLAGVAHRVALKALAKTARRQQVERQKRPAAMEAPDLSWREACTVLHEELDCLPDTYRLPLILCYLDGKSRDEAAQQLGVTTDTLRGRLERGRERLRGRLTKRGIALSAGLLALVTTSAIEGAPAEQLLRATLASAAGAKIPARVAALIKGASPSATVGKFKLVAVAILVIGLISGGLGLGMSGAPPAAQQPPAPKDEKAVPEKEKPSDAENKPVAVSGKVVGPDGKPVPKAKLFVFDTAEVKPAPQADAGADGAFAFELPPLQAGRSYRFLVATAPALGLGCDWVGVAAVSEPLRDAVLKLPRDEPIKGRVVDLEGKPLAGAQVRVTDLETGADDTLNEFVRLWSKDYEKQQQAFGTLVDKRLFARQATAAFFTATTDADGRFTMTGIGRDRCPQLTISARGKASLVCVVPIRPDFKPAPGGFTGSPVVAPEFTVPLSPSVPISGVVRDADKKPLAGVRVLGQAELSDPFRPGYLILPDVEAVTDAEGRYTLDGVPKAKKYILLADPNPGDGPARRFVTRSDDSPGFDTIKADFDLARGVVLSGQVKDKKTGQPVRAHVFYRPLWSNKWVDEHPSYESPGIAPWSAHDSGWTGTDGHFKITAIPGPGILHVQVLGHEMEREYVLAKLAAEDNTDEVLFKELGGDLKLFRTRGQGGYFSPSSLNAYRVLRIAVDAKTVTADVTVDPGVSRVVKIVDADGKPVNGVWVLNDRIFGGFSKPLAGAEFTAHALDADGSRRVFAQHDGKNLSGFIALDGKETEPALLKLEATATVTGRVVDHEGRLLKGYRIRPSYEDSEIGRLLNTRDRYDTTAIVTDADGKFTFANVPAGLSVRFEARKGDGSLGHMTAERTFKTGETLDLGEWKPK